MTKTFNQSNDKRFLIIGHARHGKDTVGEMLQQYYGFTFKSSSVAASEIFLYDALKGKYGYTTPEECFNDRVNHRAEWHQLICDYNKNDKARLAKEILKSSQVYVGMRSDEEIQACINQGLFKIIIGVFDCRKPTEDPSSFNIDLWSRADIVIPNAGSINDLRNRVIKLKNLFNNYKNIEPGKQNTSGL